MSQDQRGRWVITRGKSMFHGGSHAANLEYNCNTAGEELISISFHTTESVDADDPTLSVQWDKQPRENLKTWVRKFKDGGKRVFYFNVVDIDSFVQRLAEYRTLQVDLPYRHVSERAKFSLANATSSIENAVHACGYLVRSHLGASE